MTTAEHPFYIDGFGWLKASLLQAGMLLLDRNGHSGSLKIKSQAPLSRHETVYNLEVEDYATYHIGLFGVWVHNECNNLLPPFKAAIQRRNSGVTAFLSISLIKIKIGESLFKNKNFATVPKQIADKLLGRYYNNFNEFRSDFWKEMAKDPAVARNFSTSNLALMRRGNAPYAIAEQQIRKRKVYELDHNIEIKDGGIVYNFDNIIIRTPKDHVNKTKGK